MMEGSLKSREDSLKMLTNNSIHGGPVDLTGLVAPLQLHAEVH